MVHLDVCLNECGNPVPTSAHLYIYLLLRSGAVLVDIISLGVCVWGTPSCEVACGNARQGEWLNLKQILKRKGFEYSDFDSEDAAHDWARAKAAKNQEFHQTLAEKPPKGVEGPDWRDEECAGNRETYTCATHSLEILQSLSIYMYISHILL